MAVVLGLILGLLLVPMLLAVTSLHGPTLPLLLVEVKLLGVAEAGKQRLLHGRTLLYDEEVMTEMNHETKTRVEHMPLATGLHNGFSSYTIYAKIRC
jgi:hypothetical protein